MFSHGGNGLLANHESRRRLGDEEVEPSWLTLVCIAGVRIRFDHAPGQSVPGVWLRRLYRLFRWSGRVVLCYCESGSGASLGACDAGSVFGWSERPVVRPTCLTGNCYLLVLSG